MPKHDKESAFAELVRQYENRWVALVEKQGKEIVVGSGATPKEALVEAKNKGFPKTILFSVPSFSKALIY